MKKKLFWLVLFICLFGFIGKVEAEECRVTVEFTHNRWFGEGSWGLFVPNRATVNRDTREVCIFYYEAVLWMAGVETHRRCRTWTEGSDISFGAYDVVGGGLSENIVRMSAWDLEQVFSRLAETGSCPSLYINFVECIENEASAPLQRQGTCFYELSTIRELNTLISEGATLAEIMGETFHDLLCDLHPYLARLASRNDKSITQSININGNIRSFAAWGCSTSMACQGEACESNLEREVEQRMMAIANYCNRIYSRFSVHRQHEFFRLRTEECISFDAFYSYLVSQGIIRDLGDNCGLSEDAIGMINFFFDILMIAGPLIAIGLGIVDFAKAVVATDAAKEMKDAGGRFLKRIIAAIILLIVPMLLSFLMNIFLDNQVGYRRDNPFCGIRTTTETPENEQRRNRDGYCVSMHSDGSANCSWGRENSCPGSTGTGYSLSFHPTLNDVPPTIRGLCTGRVGYCIAQVQGGSTSCSRREESACGAGTGSGWSNSFYDSLNDVPSSLRSLCN